MSLSEEPDLTLTLGMDIDILDVSAVLALVRCYDRSIMDHITAYGMVHAKHAHFLDRVTYMQARKRNLLVLWAEVQKDRRDKEPF